jgi:hypothetical protein
LLGDLSEFIYKNANLIDFSQEPAHCWESIFKAVLNSQCNEHRIFKKNLNTLIEQNIKELGYDPRVNGPPEHIANQVVQIIQSVASESTVVIP